MRFAIFLAVFWTALSAQAHDWYDPVCCSGKDCRPLQRGEYKFEKGHWYLRNVATATEACDWRELGKAPRTSRDFQTHGCFAFSGTGCVPLCLYLEIGT